MANSKKWTCHRLKKAKCYLCNCPWPPGRQTFFSLVVVAADAEAVPLCPSCTWSGNSMTLKNRLREKFLKESYE